MAAKTTKTERRETAQQAFRQFAWHLAGTLMTVVDDASGIEVVRIPRGAVMGELDEALGDGVPLVWDDETELMVRLHWGHLSSKDEATVLAGGNHLALETDAGEWEVLGFKDAELVSPGLYKLTSFMRGRQGTDHAVGPAAASNRVVVLGERVIEKPVPAEWLGETLTLRAYAGPTDPTGQSFDVALSLAPVLPLAPVSLEAERAGMTDDVTLSWTRRSRAGGSIGGGEPPLEHAPESYRVTIHDGVTPVRTTDMSAPSLTYTAAEQTADFGAPPSAFTFTVAQRSAVFGLGHEAEGAFDD